MRKRFSAVLLCICLAAFQLTGCGNDIDSNSDSSKAEQTTTTSESALEASGSLATSESTEQTTTTTSETTTTTTTTSETTTTTTTTTTTASETTTTTTAQQAATTSAAATKATAAQTTAAAKTTTKPAATQSANVTTKAPAASSSNVKFYQNKLVVVGDSIAYGFCAYGYIPYEHNIAKGSMAMRNYTDTSLFTFNPTGTYMSCMNAISAVKPQILYVSMGMNDVNITNAQTYANNYVGFLKKVRANVPNCIIVAANITPVAQWSKFTSINNIRNCNAAMNNAVKALNDPNIILFDAYSVVSAGGLYAPSGYISDTQGVHLNGHVYQKLLDRLAVVLDQYGVKQRLS